MMGDVYPEHVLEPNQQSTTFPLIFSISIKRLGRWCMNAAEVATAPFPIR